MTFMADADPLGAPAGGVAIDPQGRIRCVNDSSQERAGIAIELESLDHRELQLAGRVLSLHRTPRRTVRRR